MLVQGPDGAQHIGDVVLGQVLPLRPLPGPLLTLLLPLCLLLAEACLRGCCRLAACCCCCLTLLHSQWSPQHAPS